MRTRRPTDRLRKGRRDRPAWGLPVDPITVITMLTAKTVLSNSSRNATRTSARFMASYYKRKHRQQKFSKKTANNAAFCRIYSNKNYPLCAGVAGTSPVRMKQTFETFPSWWTLCWARELERHWHPFHLQSNNIIMPVCRPVSTIGPTSFWGPRTGSETAFLTLTQNSLITCFLCWLLGHLLLYLGGTVWSYHPGAIWNIHICTLNIIIIHISASKINRPLSYYKIEGHFFLTGRRIAPKF